MGASGVVAEAVLVVAAAVGVAAGVVVVAAVLGVVLVDAGVVAASAGLRFTLVMLSCLAGRGCCGCWACGFIGHLLEMCPGCWQV